MDWLGNAGVWWIVAGIVLAAIELMIPGVFLIFLAAAAALVGVITLMLPDLPLTVQLLGFCAWSVVTVLIGKRWYRDFPVETADPLLNNRVARLVGEIVIVVAAIEGGHGRVRVADGEWPASGPDAPVGTRVRITGAQGASLLVEPATPALLVS
jgi:membrane protein implicated in regulation of membrane protease activity